MLDGLINRARQAADTRRAKVIARLIAATPKGVRATQNDAGVMLSGRKLRWRFLHDARLRDFWR